MKQIVRKVLIVMLLVVFLGSGGVFLWKQMDYRNGAQNYEEAAELAQADSLEEVGEEEEPEETIDLSALQKVNDQVIGWILIPDTGISYPLLLGDDNDYYLNHTWDGTRSSVGAIFVDYRNSQALDDFNTIIYGHKMNNDAMFGLLHEYKNEGYLEAHPSLYITDRDGTHQYDIFAYYETATTNTYRRDFADDGEKTAYIDECLAQRWVDNGIQPGVEDHIITLSTCTGNGHATRWVVQAVRNDA